MINENEPVINNTEKQTNDSNFAKLRLKHAEKVKELTNKVSDLEKRLQESGTQIAEFQKKELKTAFIKEGGKESAFDYFYKSLDKEKEVDWKDLKVKANFFFQETNNFKPASDNKKSYQTEAEKKSLTKPEFDAIVNMPDTDI